MNPRYLAVAITATAVNLLYAPGIRLLLDGKLKYVRHATASTIRSPATEPPSIATPDERAKFYEQGKWAGAFAPRKKGERRYWLVKSEPDTFSFDDLLKRPKQTTTRDGVRNSAARNFLR